MSRTQTIARASGSLPAARRCRTEPPSMPANMGSRAARRLLIPSCMPSPRQFTPPQPDKKKKASASVDLLIDKPQFQVLFTFNRVGIEPLETGDLLLHFGFVNGAGQMAAFAAVLEWVHCVQSLKSWSDYVEKIGGPKAESDDAFRVNPALLRSSFLPTVNFVNWNRTGEMGEIRLFAFSMTDLLAASKTGEKIAVQPAALLRCSLEIQAQLLFKIIKRVRHHEILDTET